MLRTLAAEAGVFGLITVIDTRGSSPTKPGAMMAVRSDGTVIGSIAGGCVEGAVYELALASLDDGRARMDSYGPDGDLILPGLTCGGYLTALIEVMEPDFVRQALAVRDETGGVTWQVDVTAGSLGTRSGPAPLGAAGVDEPGITADGAHYKHVSVAPPQMLIIGSTAYAQTLCATAAAVGYDVTVCDARRAFVTPERFPAAVEVVATRPSRWLTQRLGTGELPRFDAVVVATHDPKIDVPTLAVLLNLPAEQRPGYLGALGSQRAARDRRAALAEAGVDAELIAGLRSPVGLDLGDATPEQTAVAILAEIIHRGTGRGDQPIISRSGSGAANPAGYPNPVGPGLRDVALR